MDLRRQKRNVGHRRRIIDGFVYSGHGRRSTSTVSPHRPRGPTRRRTWPNWWTCRSPMVPFAACSIAAEPRAAASPSLQRQRRPGAHCERRPRLSRSSKHAERFSSCGAACVRRRALPWWTPAFRTEWRPSAEPCSLAPPPPAGGVGGKRDAGASLRSSGAECAPPSFNRP